MEPMVRSELPLPLLARGKVRDIYAVGEDRLLLVATDRLSAFDVVMNEPVPGKGAVLTQISAWWFKRLDGVVDHHLISVDIEDIVAAEPELAAHREALAGRTMLCRRVKVVPVECVVRGYLSGSAWKEYSREGTLAGEPLAAGMQLSQKLDPPLFSPAAKAETGHDQNITIAQMGEAVGTDLASELERLSRTIYGLGQTVGAERGLIVADTKFEFGQDESGAVVLIDEVLTPDSSRFWPADRWVLGQTPPSFDKQPLRDYLDGERAAGRWNGEAPPPPLPAEVVAATAERYRELYARVTGSELAF